MKYEHVKGQQETKTSWIRPNSNQSRSWILRSREVKLSARTMKTNVDKFWQWIWSYYWQVQFSAITMEKKDHKEWPVFTSCLCDKLLNHFLHPIGPALFVTMRANTFTDTFFSFFHSAQYATVSQQPLWMAILATKFLLSFHSSHRSRFMLQCNLQNSPLDLKQLTQTNATKHHNHHYIIDVINQADKLAWAFDQTTIIWSYYCYCHCYISWLEPLTSLFDYVVCCYLLSVS